MSFWNSFAEGFTPAFDKSLTNYREQQNADRDFGLREAEHKASMEERGLRLRQLKAQGEDADNIRGARRALQSAETNGVMTGAVQGLSAPSTKMAFEGGAGYGSGAGAVKEMAGDYDREMRRFGVQAPEGQYDASGVGQRAAGDRDIAGLRKNLALASGDDAGYDRARGTEKKLNISDRFKEKKGKGRDGYRDEVYSRINLDGDMPFTVADETDDKGKPTGFKSVHLVDRKGKASTLRLDQSQEEQMLLGISMMEEGDEAEGLQVIAGVNKTLAERAKEALGIQLDVVRGGNDARSSALGARNDAVRTGIAASGLKIQQQESNRAEARDVINLVDKDGKAAVFPRSAIPVGKNGQLTLPQGMTLPNQRSTALDPKAKATFYSNLAGRLETEEIDALWSTVSGEADPNAVLLEALRAKDAALAPKK